MVIGLYLATFIASLAILINLLLRHKRTTNIVLLFNIITTIQSFGRFIVSISNDIEISWLGNMFIYIGACFCPLIVIIVLNRLCLINMPKWFLGIISGYTVLVYALSLTIGFSDIYYISFRIVQGNGFNYLAKEYGPGHILYLIMVIMDFSIIIACLIIAIKNSKKVSLRTIRPIVCLAVIILSSYILQKVFKSHISYLTIGYFFALIFCVYFLGHVTMFDININIANCIENRMENGYVQFDDKFRCAGYNDKFLELFPEVTKKWNIDDPIPEDDSFLYKEVIAWFLKSKKGDKKTIQIGHNFYELSISEIPYGNNPCVGYMLEFFDRTAENKYLEAIEKNNSNLKKEVFAQEKEIDQINNVFGKVVDPYVRDYLLKGNVTLGGETRDVTVMFCDIRSFTTISENLEPAQVVDMLNFYFTALGKCITKNHGIVNKYIGDAIMAIFGAPVPSENHALDAYNAAMDMRKALIDLNKNFSKKGWPEIHSGIGIHSGKALAGNIGAINRMEYTVIGDTVNTASRVESLCKEYETDLLITDVTAERLGNIREKLIFVNNATVRGKEELVRLFTQH